MRGSTLDVHFGGAIVLLRVRPRRLIDKGGVGRQHHGALFRLLPVVEGGEAPGLLEEGKEGGREGGREEERE